MKESDIQSKLIKKYEAEGYYVIKLMKTNKNGIPDLLLIPKDSNVEFVEVKTESGNVSELQEFRIKELKSHGINVKVVRDAK